MTGPRDRTAMGGGRVRSREMRRMKDRVFAGVCIACAASATIVLVTLLTSVVTQALGLFYSESQGAKHFAIGLCLLGAFAGLASFAMLLHKSVRGGATPRRAIGIAIALAVLVLSILGFDNLKDAGEGRSFLTAAFVEGMPSRDTDKAGIKAAMVGTLWVCAICGLFAVPVGVATAVYIEEFKPRRRIARRLHTFVQLNITNLAGVPSIVYGILGVTAFANMFGLVEQRQDELPRAIGVRYYDRFETEGKRMAWVRVDERTAPPTTLAADTAFEDERGEPMRLTLVTAEEVVPRQEEAERAADDFIDALKDAAEDLEPVTVAGVTEAARKLLPGAGLEASPERVIGVLEERLAAADLGAGREVSRALRRIAGDVEKLEASARFAGLIRTDAYAMREARKSWWYLQVPMGRSVLAGGLTLGLVILPIIIIATQESLRAVPQSVRQAALALGATPWQTIWKTALPSSVPGIMTGTILSMSRAIGEAAPLLIIAGIVYITFTPENVMDKFTVMPLQIFEWARRPQAEFYQLAAAGILLLLAILLAFNAIAIYVRQRTQKTWS